MKDLEPQKAVFVLLRCCVPPRTATVGGNRDFNLETRYLGGHHRAITDLVLVTVCNDNEESICALRKLAWNVYDGLIPQMVNMSSGRTAVAAWPAWQGLRRQRKAALRPREATTEGRIKRGRHVAQAYDF